MHNTTTNILPSLIISDLEINPPFILGGMGVRITNHTLVSAAANLGMAGTIASVGLCPRNTKKDKYVEASNKALSNEIHKSRALSKGIIGVNVMYALTNYNDLVKTSVEEKVDYIVSGAGLPLNLPELANNSHTKLIPIVSSLHATKIIIKRWKTKYNRLPDALIVEGVLAGGHLGYSQKEVASWGDNSLLSLCKIIIDYCTEIERQFHKHIPVIAAGGIYDGKDIAKYLKAGIEGVQMSTRFIATNECSAPVNYKQAIINSKKEDMLIINSPVGLLGRAIKNPFVDKITNNVMPKFNCPYHCLKTCNPETAPYCIAEALVNAHEGDLENGLIMAGYNAYRIHDIVPIKVLTESLINETLSCL
jgi:nitronate monooxygenase